MISIYALIKKELRGYFNSPLAYIFIIFFLVVSSWLYARSLFLIGQADMRNFFILTPWVFLFLVPAISMRLLAEEKKLGTFEILMTWPVKDWEAALGKYFGVFCFLLITVLGSLAIPILLAFIGKPDWGGIAGSYLGLIFLGASFCAISLWASSLTDNQIIAFIVAIAVIFVLFMLGSEAILMFLPNGIAGFLRELSLGTHYDSMSRGVLDSRDVIYYLSVIGFFLYLTIKSIEKRKS